MYPFNLFNFHMYKFPVEKLNCNLGLCRWGPVVLRELHNCMITPTNFLALKISSCKGIFLPNNFVSCIVVNIMASRNVK